MSAGGAGAVRLGGAFIEVVLKSTVEGGLTQIGARLKEFAAQTLSVMAVEEVIRRSITAFIDMGAEMDRLSKKTGISATELSRLSYAAKMNDTDINTVANSMRFLQRNMVEAESGSKSAQAKFVQLGVTLQSLRGKDAAQQMMLIADQFQKLPTAAERTAAAMELFGRGGVALIPILSEGSAGINKMMEEADRLGITMDEAMVKKAEGAQKGLIKLKATTEALLIHIGYGLTPSFNLLAEAIGRAAKGLERWQNFRENWREIAQTLFNLSLPGMIFGKPVEWKETEAERGVREKKEARERGLAEMTPEARAEFEKEEEAKRREKFLTTPEGIEEAKKEEEKKAAEKHKEFLAYQDAAMQRLANAQKLEAERLKQQWESGKISMEEYYKAIYENQKTQLMGEINILSKKREETEDQAEKKKLGSEIASRLEQMSLEELKMQGDIAKGQREASEKAIKAERDLAEARASAGKEVGSAKAERERAQQDELYERRKRQVEEDKESGVLSAREAFESIQQIDKEYAETRLAAKQKAIDEEIAYEQEALERAATEEEKIRINAALGALKIRRETLGIEEGAEEAGIAGRKFQEAQMGAPAGAAIGTFSGALAGKAGFGVGDVFRDQLTTMKSMDDKLKKVVDNTAAGGLE